MKKVFVASLILLIVMLIFLGIYNFAFKKETTPIIKPAAETPVAEISGKDTSVKKMTAISVGGVLGPVIDNKTDEIRYYDAATSFVWKMDADGQKKQQTTSISVNGLVSVLWSSDLKKVLTVTQKNGKSSFYMYDHTTQKGTALKDGLDTVVWDNIGAKIFYKYYDAKSQERTLNVANPDGSGWQKLADISAKNLVIAPVPLTSTVSYWNAASNAEETKLQTIGITGGEPKTILAGRYGADYLWSPDGSMALVSSLVNKDSKSMTLGIVSMDGKYQDLNIPTLVSKCVWSKDGKTIYYALPGDIPAGSVMPNDYQANKFNTDDTFWKLNIATGEKKRIIEVTEINGKYDSSQLFLSPAEDGLYFVNRSDKKLYLISLQ